MEKITISDIDFACDVKDFISSSSDASFENENLKKMIFDSDDLQLLKITKTIASPIKIIGVEKVDEAFVEKNL